MKKILFLLIGLLFFIPNIDAKELDVYLFHSSLCSHCKDEITWLESIKEEYDLNLVLFEVSQDKGNYDKMVDVINKMKINKNPVTPFTIIGNTYYFGFKEFTKESMLKQIKLELDDSNENVVKKILNNEDISNIEIKAGVVDNIKTIFGEINLSDLSLPLVAIIIGFIDGFNPCAMWVLLFLISMLLGMKNRRKMWTIGLTFLITSALVYLSFMLAWLQIAINLTQITFVRFIIGLIALVGGAINIKAYLEERKKDDGCHIVDNKKRKNITKKMKSIIGLVDIEENNFWKSEKSFILAIFGIIGLAISVNLIELACSSGLPLIFTQILALNDLSSFQYFSYILIYILFFLLDDVLIFTIAMKTMKLTGISTKYNKLSHLIGGAIMILIGILMIFAPSLLMFNF